MPLITEPQFEIDKKKNGVFYTPIHVAQILCDWAIRTRYDSVLEPSFGGCHFLNGARKRLTLLGTSHLDSQLYGCDIDPKAFFHLHNLVGNDEYGRFLQNDFLKLHPGDFGAGDEFDVVIGNPPYVSHHNLSKEQYQIAQKAVETTDVKLRGKVSLWAYFVMHSLKFVKNGGRMAWILPSSFLYADYAKQVKEAIQKNFSNSLVVQLGERLFLTDGTEEVSVIVLCDEKQDKPQQGTLEIAFASDVDEMQNCITEWASDSWVGASYETNATLALLHNEALTIYTELDSRADRLGNFCDIQIGVVSGANKFFIVTDEKAKAANLPEDVLVFVLPRFRYAKGIKMTLDDFEQIRRDGKPCFLVDTTRTEHITGYLKEYLSTFSETERKNNTTFRRRSQRGVWHRFNDERIPDAFFPYMLKDGPFIVLNDAQVNSTNSIHRLYFDDSVHEAKRKAIAISILSTFSQLSAEIEGRAYGAGVLKHEPSEAARIKVIVPSNVSDEVITVVFERVHQFILSGQHDKAQALADDFVMRNYSEAARQRYINILTQALQIARKRRLPENGDRY